MYDDDGILVILLTDSCRLKDDDYDDDGEGLMVDGIMMDGYSEIWTVL